MERGREISFYIPRLFYIETRFFSRQTLVSTGLDTFLGVESGLEEVVEEYKLLFHGILVQDPGSGELDLLISNDYIVFKPGYHEHCHWHNGPIDKRDNPLERSYCLKPLYTSLGYCREHYNSLRAVYSQCFTSSGLRSLSSCRRLDGKLGFSLKYSVYLLDYGYGLKVGSTRSWRLYDRIGEQPHVVALRLIEYSSAFETRDLELRIGSREGFTERPRRRGLKDIISYPPRLAYKRLYDASRKIVKELGLGIESSSLRLFKVTPSLDITYYVRARETSVDKLYNEKLEIMDYWMGYLLLASTRSSEYYVVKTRNLLHSDTVDVPR